MVDVSVNRRAPALAQRQLQMRLGQDGLCPSGNAALYGAARASRLCCLALSEELLYRSVLYGWLGMLSEDFRRVPSGLLALGVFFGWLRALRVLSMSEKMGPFVLMFLQMLYAGWPFELRLDMRLDL